MTRLIFTKLNPIPIPLHHNVWRKGLLAEYCKRHKYSQLLFALLVTNRGPTPTLTCIIKSDDTRVTEAAVTFKLTIA